MENETNNEASSVLSELQTDLVRRLHVDADLSSVLAELVDKTASILHASACAIFTIDGDRAILRAGSGHLRQLADRHAIVVIPSNKVPEKPQRGHELGLTGWIISTGQPFLAQTAADLGNHPHYSSRLDAIQPPDKSLQVDSFLGFPIRGSRGETIGLIRAERHCPESHDSETPRPNPFLVDDELALETIARVASRFLTYLDMAQQRRGAEAVTSWARDVIAETAATEGELDSFLDVAAKVTAAAMRADSCGIFLKDESGKTLTERAGIGSQALRKVIRAYPWPDDASLGDCRSVATCSPPTCPHRSVCPKEHSLGPSMFTPDTIRDLPSFARKLNRPADPLSTYLNGMLSDATRRSLAQYERDASDSLVLQSLLAEDLNRIIEDGPIYDSHRFEGIILSPETERLLAKIHEGHAVIRLNRQLLEEAYPLNISRRVGLTAWIAATGKTFHARNFQELSNHCHHRGNYDEWNFEKGTTCGAFLGIPLHVGGSIIGVIKVENTANVHLEDSRDFSPEAQQQFEILAQDIALAIQRLQRQIPARYRIIQEAQETLLEILRGGLELPELVEKVVVDTQNLFKAGACALFLKEGNKLVQRAARGWAELGPKTREYELVAANQIKQAPASRDEKVGLTVWIGSMQEKFTARSNTELRMHPHHRGTFDPYNFKAGDQCESFMGFPMVIEQDGRNELVGVLKVETKKKVVVYVDEVTYFSELDEIAFGLIARSAAIAIRNTRLQEAAAKATQIAAWKQFSAMAAHSVGTGINNISGAYYYLEKDLRGTAAFPVAEKYLKRISDALKGTYIYIQELMQLTNPLELTVEPLNINELCKQVVANVASGGIKVELRLASEIRDIEGDRNKLLYAFTEMSHNAIKAMQDRGGSLTITTRSVDNGSMARIEFEDTGPGVRPDMCDTIYEPGITGRPGGNGLGLAIVATTVRQHKGTIKECGTFGTGAHFVIDLPVRPPDGAKERILIVEDNKYFREDLEKAVGTDSLTREVVCVSNEKEAAQQIRSTAFDVVITDINLSEGGTPLGGQEVLKAALEKDRHTALIVVTSYIDPKTKLSAIDRFCNSEMTIMEMIEQMGVYAFIPRSPDPAYHYLDSVKEFVAKALARRAHPNRSENHHRL